MNEIVKQNNILKKDVNIYLLQLKALKERCLVLDKLKREGEMEKQNLTARLVQRWVEGSSEQSSDHKEKIESDEANENNSNIVKKKA